MTPVTHPLFSRKTAGLAAETGYCNLELTGASNLIERMATLYTVCRCIMLGKSTIEPRHQNAMRFEEEIPSVHVD